jgi:hypothetical protein
MNKNKKITGVWNDPVWSKVIASLIILLCGVILSFFKGWWPIIGQFTGVILSWFRNYSTIANWVFVLFIFCAIVVIGLLVIITWAIFSKNNTEQNWRSYTTDEFFGIRWRWHLNANGAVDGIHSFCPGCDFQVFPRNVSYFGTSAPRIAFKCDDCGRNIGEFEIPYEEMESRVERLIQKSIRAGTWQTKNMK